MLFDIGGELGLEDHEIKCCQTDSPHNICGAARKMLSNWLDKSIEDNYKKQELIKKALSDAMPTEQFRSLHTKLSNTSD